MKNVLHADLTPHEKRWGSCSDISKLIIALYDETAHTGLARDKQVAEKCLELWDIMFEKQDRSGAKFEPGTDGKIDCEVRYDILKKMEYEKGHSVMKLQKPIVRKIKDNPQELESVYRVFFR